MTSIFNSIKKSDIRVGYIDSSGGFVQDISICEANDYAQKNPGTRFIFKDGDNNIRILNINGVNKLTPNDLVPKNKCPGLQTPKRCNRPPTIEITGGGGLGARANAIIGSDGSLIAIDVVDGGFGYTSPPKVKIVEPCKKGSGAVATAVIDDIINTPQLYELEPEYYEICEKPTVSYGKLYGSSGKDFGEWDFTNYSINVSTASTTNTSPIYVESDCPPSPIWSTHSPGAKTSWYKTNNKQWSIFTNNYAITPINTSTGTGQNLNNFYTNSWKVIVPYRGYYGIKGTVKGVGKVFVDGNQVGVLKRPKDNNPAMYKVFLEKGEHEISIEVQKNPTEPNSTLAVSVIMIPPPCPKKVKGKGVVTKIIINHPGNGYTNGPGIGTTGNVGFGTTGIIGITTNVNIDVPPGNYPIILELVDVVIPSGGNGINYNPNEDQIKVVPDNGAELTYKTGPFGIIENVTVIKPGIGFTAYPYIYIKTKTGINFFANPVFNVIRSPNAFQIPSQNIIQITDLVGIKQTGFVRGKPYFGSVYYENGIKYAGNYKTPGTPIQVYDTLQESITGKVTTRPSAIQKSGSDIQNNNPNLNIPGTI